MSLAKSIVDAVNKAAKSLGDLLVTATLTKRSTGTFDRATGVATPSDASYSLKGFVDEWEYNEVDGSLVRYDDVKFVAFSSTPDVDVSVSDLVTINGVAYSVIKCTPTFAGSMVVIRTLQLRK